MLIWCWRATILPFVMRAHVLRIGAGLLLLVISPALAADSKVEAKAVLDAWIAAQNAGELRSLPVSLCAQLHWRPPLRTADRFVRSGGVDAGPPADVSKEDDRVGPERPDRRGRRLSAPHLQPAVGFGRVLGRRPTSSNQVWSARSTASTSTSRVPRRRSWCVPVRPPSPTVAFGRRRRRAWSGQQRSRPPQ
jgi:hypothetical protein